MRLPFLQMESDLLAHGAAEVAHLAGCSVPLAVGHIAMVRAWAVSMADDSAPPDGWVAGDAAGRRIEAAAQWTGERGRLLEALTDAGQVRVEDGGIRVLHLEPYAKAWEQNAKSKERMRSLRERSANTDARTAKFDGQTQTQTQTQKAGTEDLFPAVASAPQRPKAARKASPDKPTDPRHAPLVRALVEEQGWELGGGRGAKAVTALLAAADEAPATRGEAAPAEVLRRAANALEKRRVAPLAFPAVAALWELAQHWAHFAVAPGRATGPPVSQAHVGGHDDSHHECAGCGADGVASGVGEPQVFLGYECGCLGAFMTDLQNGLHFTKAQEWARKRRAA